MWQLSAKITLLTSNTFKGYAELLILEYIYNTHRTFNNKHTIRMINLYTCHHRLNPHLNLVIIGERLLSGPTRIWASITRKLLLPPSASPMLSISGKCRLPMNIPVTYGGHVVRWRASALTFCS